MRTGIEVAHSRCLRVTVHTVDQTPAIEALEAGADGLEHGVALEAITVSSVIAALLRVGATYTPPLSIHENVEAASNLKMVAAGVSPLQTLQAATGMAALQLVRSDLGRVAPGARADLILIASDPLADISHLRDLMVTIQGGRVVVDRR